jgi:hypothetical protein
MLVLHVLFVLVFIGLVVWGIIDTVTDKQSPCPKGDLICLLVAPATVGIVAILQYMM